LRMVAHENARKHQLFGKYLSSYTVGGCMDLKCPCPLPAGCCGAKVLPDPIRDGTCANPAANAVRAFKPVGKALHAAARITSSANVEWTMAVEMFDRCPLSVCALNPNVRFEAATTVRTHFELALYLLWNLPLVCHVRVVLTAKSSAQRRFPPLFKPASDVG
jgi:hypothetical protein